jgi:alpha-galactosidase
LIKEGSQVSEKIVLIGAGSAQFGLGTIGEILQSTVLAGFTIMLHDINGEALKKVADTAQAFVTEKKLPFEVQSSLERKEALKGASFVIVSIEVGDRFALWDQDRTVPQQYGITQIYGENGGPGGVFHSLRIIPPILEICADAAELCPDANIFCYSNPMTAICTTVSRAYPALKFTGLCHEIASLPRYLPVILDTPFENLHLVAGGLNHFSVVLQAHYKDSGRDAYPDILRRAPAFFEKEPGYGDIWAWMKRTGERRDTEGAQERFAAEVRESAKPWADRGVFRAVLEHFHLLPVTVDSHFGEYIGWAHDVADHKGIMDFLELYKDMLATVQPRIELKTKERIVAIMEGVLTDSGYREEAVNVRNGELVVELPDFISVEVPATIHADGVRGEKLPRLPPGFAALLRNYVGVYDLTAEAVLQKSKELVVQALLVNPVTNRARDLVELVDHMIDLQPKWLGYLS